MFKHSFPFALLLLCTIAGCSHLNDSWEVKGGGYLKYSINDGKEYTIELDEDDVVRPSYSRSFFQVQTRIEESSRKDQFSILVNRPVLGKNNADPTYSWMKTKDSNKKKLVGEKNIIKIDQKDDSTWTAFVDLQFQDCSSKDCLDSIPLHVTGRLRYWIPEDER